MNENRLDHVARLDLAQVKDLIENRIPFFKKVGIVVESVSRRKLKLKIPYDPGNLNHLGTFQAGIYLTLAESAGGALLATAIDLSDVLLLTKECCLRFRHPARTELTYEGVISEEVVSNLMQRLEQDRKFDIPLQITLLNERGKIAAESTVTYYLRKGLDSFQEIQRRLTAA